MWKFTRIAVLLMALSPPAQVMGFVVKPFLSRLPKASSTLLKSSHNDQILVNNVLMTLGRLDECLFSEDPEQLNNVTHAVNAAIDEDRLIYEVQPPSNQTIDSAVAEVHDKAISLNTEMFDEMIAEQALMEAASVAQTLAACTAWFPPAACVFEATAAVSYVGVALDEAIIAARKHVELSYINSIVEKVRQTEQLKPLVDYQDSVQTLTNSVQNVGARPLYARAGLLNCCLDLRADKTERNFDNVKDKIDDYDWSSYNDLTPHQRRNMCALVTELQNEKDPEKVKDLNNQIGKIWPQWLKAGGSLMAAVVMGALTASFGKKWAAARNIAFREAERPLLDEDGEPVEEIGPAAEAEEAGLFERYSVRLSSWEIAGSAAGAVAGVIGGIMAGLQIASLKKDKKQMEDKINQLTSDCSNYYKSVAVTMGSEKK